MVVGVNEGGREERKRMKQRRIIIVSLAGVGVPLVLSQRID